jgi:CheY-like chemotaxis protein
LSRILIVDGNPSTREPLERALADEGLDVVAAGDPEAGWEAFTAFAPSVVVLGRRLPREDAEELIARLRQADPAILFLSQEEPWTDMARRLRVRLGAPAPRALSAAPDPVGPGTARVLTRPPLETGPLAFGSLADLMARLWRTAADGIVSIDRPGGTDRIFLLRGVAVEIRVAGERAGGDPSGALASLCAAGYGSFGFHPGSDFASEVRGARLPALAPLLAGLRLAADEPSFAEALAVSGDRVARRAAASGSVLRELAPDPHDLATLSAMDGRATVQDLVQGAGRPASLLWFLLRTGAAELGAAAEASRAATPDATPGETGLHAPA